MVIFLLKALFPDGLVQAWTVPILIVLILQLLGIDVLGMAWEMIQPALEGLYNDFLSWLEGVFVDAII